jgi:hypothetical protein
MDIVHERAAGMDISGQSSGSVMVTRVPLPGEESHAAMEYGQKRPISSAVCRLSVVYSMNVWAPVTAWWMVHEADESHDASDEGAGGGTDSWPGHPHR